MSRARPAPVEEFARYHNIVEGLCIASGLPKPRLYVVDDPAPNAFATGRNPRNAAVAVTTGLLEKMNRIELEGVLAHELSHVKNYDILVSTLAVTMVGIVALLADIGIRLLWWGMGRNPYGDYDREHGGNQGPLAILSAVGFALLLLSPVIATGDAANRQPAPGDAGRRVRRGDDPLPARADLGPGEAARRLHGGARHQPRHRAPVDRAAGRADRSARAGCRASTACSTPTRRSRSASPSSASSNGPSRQLDREVAGDLRGCRP